MAVAGWVLAGRDPESRTARWWLVVPLVATLLTTVIFYGAHRIRAPAEPAVVALAAFGMVAVVDRARHVARADGSADVGQDRDAVDESERGVARDGAATVRARCRGGAVTHHTSAPA
jgi:hypothetical protein